MAEKTTEVRLVRCPKCKNLLPEPKDCSFFKCGGCGAVLCAKNKDSEADSELDKSVKNRAKETEVHFSSSEEESESDTSLRHQKLSETETCDVHSTDPCLKNVADSCNNDSQSSLDRFKKRTMKRYNSEGFRFSASNNFPDSKYSEDRAGVVRKLDKLKEEFLQPKEQQIPSSSSGFKSAPLRFPSNGKHFAGSSYYNQYPEPEQVTCRLNNNPDVSLHGRMHKPAHIPAYGTLEPSHSREYIGNNGHDLLDQSACFCFHCYDPYHRASGSVFAPSGLLDALHHVGFYPHERSTGFRRSLHSPRTFIPHHQHHPGSKSHGPQFHGRCLSKSGNALKKVVSSSGGSRLIHPVAGGAPFINCRNCSKLLKLPENTDSSTRKQQRLRCGACSCFIDFSFFDKKLILSTDPAASARIEEPHVSTGQALISEKAQEMQIASSTSLSVSEDELNSDSPKCRKLIPDSPLVRDRSRPRSQRSCSEQDKVTLSKTSMRQNSMKEHSVEIEMDVNDYSQNSGVSQDSANDYRENHVRTKKGGYASIMKNSFKDLKNSIKNESKSDVLVNGYLVAEHLVKMAEKQAGPIRPGNYWYDYRAGFWGIMGGQCLGILPPFIEELNYPMQENCASGNTRVFVNGRELHDKDLRLLTARGLPRDRDRSYTIYMSGRVIDEDTGEELHSLGKLAPTVDKLKRGFGMRVPRKAV